MNISYADSLEEYSLSIDVKSTKVDQYKTIYYDFSIKKKIFSNFNIGFQYSHAKFNDSDDKYLTIGIYPSFHYGVSFGYSKKYNNFYYTLGFLAGYGLSRTISKFSSDVIGDCKCSTFITEPYMSVSYKIIKNTSFGAQISYFMISSASEQANSSSVAYSAILNYHW